MTGCDKHSSLLQYRVNYGRKKFYDRGLLRSVGVDTFLITKLGFERIEVVATRPAALAKW